MTAFLDLFAGIGGFAFGAYSAGLRFDAHYFSEVDDYATRVYNARFPDAEPLGDIRAIRGADLPRGDWIIAGGFPCQDISVAGKGAGLAGERSGLWYEYARLIGELRPRFAIMENVGALAFRGLDEVLGSLAALGYDAEWQDIRASDVGAPHKRERLWIVAYPNSGRAYTESRSISGGSNPLQPDRHGSIRNVADTSSGGCERRDISTRPWAEGEGTPDADGRRDDVADASPFGRRERRARRLDPSGAGEPEQALSLPDSDDSRRNASGPTEPSERETKPAMPRDDSQSGSRNDWWATEPDVGRVASRLSSALDGGMSNEQMATKESSTESDTQDGEVRNVRINEEPTKTSSRLQQANGSENTLPGMPCEGRSGGWDQAQKTNAEMRSMRKDVRSAGFAQAQDLRLNLSSDPRTRKRIEAVAWENEPDIGRVATGVPNRVNRLKCLGNSIVPQIAELIFSQAVFDEWRVA